MQFARAARNRQEILLFNRKREVLENERVYERALMEFCYGTRVGIFLTNWIFKRRLISKLYGFWTKLPVSKKKISAFAKDNNIDLDELLFPWESFKSLNSFFTRKLDPKARPVDMQPDILVSPADSRMLVCNLDKERIVPVKGHSCTVAELLGTPEFDSEYRNGTCLIFRLAPGDYHRFGYIDRGVQGSVWEEGRSLHSVNPIALSSGMPVFIQNHRQAVLLETENFGSVIHVDVGAMIVGRIVQHHPKGHFFSKGEEKGYFEFGGSTIVLLFKPNILVLDRDIYNSSAQGIETLVSYGEAIGKRLQ